MTFPVVPAAPAVSVDAVVAGTGSVRDGNANPPGQGVGDSGDRAPADPRESGSAVTSNSGSNTLRIADPAALLELAMRCARAAGAELMRRYGNVQGLNTKSSINDPVSDADRESELLLVRMIRAERPDDGIIGEEGASQPSTSGVTWVLDPLDGTVNYLYELDNFAVSVGVEDADGGLAGAVFNPATNSMFTATRGGGAFVDGRPLAVNEPVDLDRALVGTGFGYSAERRARQAAIAAALLPRIRDIRRIGSAALDLCSVAAGRLDAYYEEGVNHWDVAAGGLIAVEAGAVMTKSTLTGAPTGWLVAGPSLHAELLAALNTLG